MDAQCPQTLNKKDISIFVNTAIVKKPLLRSPEFQIGNSMNKSLDPKAFHVRKAIRKKQKEICREKSGTHYLNSK